MREDNNVLSEEWIDSILNGNCVFVGQDTEDNQSGEIRGLDGNIANNFELARAAIGCEFIEFIPTGVYRNGTWHPLIVMCDEYGSFNSSLRCNTVISNLRRTAHMQILRSRGLPFSGMTNIVGNVIILMEQEEEEEN